MNIVDILIVAILAFGVLAGMHKGLIASGLSTVGFVAAWFGAQSLYERIANFALSNQTLMAVLNQYLEPEEFFATPQQAMTTVAEVVSGGEAAISSAVASLGKNFTFLTEAFSNNIRQEAFQNLGITTLSDYLNQTLWVAIFNVAAFVAAFLLIYIVINLVVNLLDHVINFPVLRGVDWLLGGVLGLLKATVVVALVLAILPSVAGSIAPELTEKLMSGSALIGFAQKFDLLNAGGLIRGLLKG